MVLQEEKAQQREKNLEEAKSVVIEEDASLPPAKAVAYSPSLPPSLPVCCALTLSPLSLSLLRSRSVMRGATATSV